MIRMLLGGSFDSFKTLTSEDAVNIQNRLFYQNASGIFYGGRNDRSHMLSSLVDLVQGEVFADNTALIGATRFDKKFTTSLLTKSNSELLQEVGRMQQMHIRGLETRTGKNVKDLLKQLKDSAPDGQSIVARLRGTLVNNNLTDQELVELTGLSGTFDWDAITKLKPNEISDILNPLVSMSGEQFASHIKTMPGLRRKRLHIKRSLKAVRVDVRSVRDSKQYRFKKFDVFDCGRSLKNKRRLFCG